jgi:hypothetical protein
MFKMSKLSWLMGLGLIVLSIIALQALNRPTDNKLSFVENSITDGGDGAGTLDQSVKANEDQVVEVKFIEGMIEDRLSGPIDIAKRGNIFIGKVESKLGDDGSHGPRTQFEVRVLKNIKGNLSGTITVEQYARVRDGILYVDAPGNDVTQTQDTFSRFGLLEPGSTYVLAVSFNSFTNWYSLSVPPDDHRLITGDSSLTDEQLIALADQDGWARTLDGYVNVSRNSKPAPEPWPTDYPSNIEDKFWSLKDSYTGESGIMRAYVCMVDDDPVYTILPAAGKRFYYDASGADLNWTGEDLDT